MVRSYWMRMGKNYFMIPLGLALVIYYYVVVI